MMGQSGFQKYVCVRESECRGQRQEEKQEKKD